MKRLLIVEDEMVERIVLKKMLQKKFGDICLVFEAQNGREAIEVFRKEKIQIAILDIGMPGINGIQAAEIMRKEDPHCCLIFLTAYDRFDYAKKAISIKAMEYLLKPYSQKEVIGVVEEALRISSDIRRDIEEEKEAEIQENDMLSDKETDHSGSRLSVMAAMVEEYIRSNFMNDISMNEIACSIGYSEPYFCKMFKQQFGQSFTSYLMEYRVNEAKKFLEQPNVIVKEVGARVGYPDSNYFTKVFKRLVGINPSEYRMKCFSELS